MAIRDVKSQCNRSLKQQAGMSLIELLVASTIGILAIMAVGSMFISGQKLATERSLKLLVLQNMNDAMRYIKEDAQRAGFNGNNGSSLILSGASEVITVTSSAVGATLAYIYENNNGDITYTKFTGDTGTKKLGICTKSNISRVSPVMPTCSAIGEPGLSLMDDSRVILSQFVIDETPLGNSVSSAYFTITMKAKLASPPTSGQDYEQTMVTKIKQRNWQ
ncbi:hypothetical protein HC723_03625 [Vibrio sp. S11_S32]|uniref:PilW family protein n=1 Tax=Vibrio sp. S11_S32 TaxID=2720225 RepID=UPI001681491C|nr:hypothetical protein [Vibrio sp. S11_S32]MBD1575545.1 hypothetical protein [Vibrio sp. S11_S32]